MKGKKYTVTSALLYANGPVHIGHIAGAYLPADIYVRYLKSTGNEVVFISGSDEHGAAITIQAKKEKTSPKNIIEKYHALNKKSFEEFGIDFSIYDRTSDKMHHETSQEFFTTLNKKNTFTKKKSSQFYDEKESQFLADRYITGECPKCGYANAYGDQCENCGSDLNPEELINPVSTLSGEKPILKDTTHWYLPMQKHEKWLKKWIEKGVFSEKQLHNPNKWKKHVLGQCKSWIDMGLKERAMTRDLDWGVKVPIHGAENKVLYVWLDAPIGYISATKKWAKKNRKNWEDYWKNEETNLVHFIGKDNIVFHCIMFPIILNAHTGYILPKNVPANAFLNLEGRKLSTSKNWAIWLHEYLKDFENKQDVLRYVLCSIGPENKDSDFTWNDFQARNNNELVAIFGNFINRVVVLIHKYWGGKVPSCDEIKSIDKKIIKSIKNVPEIIGNKISEFKYREAVSELMNLARLGNKYLAEQEPWKLIKKDEKRVQTIMNISVQVGSALAILCEPFMPFTAKKLRTMLNLDELKWEDAGKMMIKDGNIINKPIHLFEKIENEKINEQIDKLNKRL